jgi:thiol-disulfide isomerase/thioredoxin
MNSRGNGNSAACGLAAVAVVLCAAVVGCSRVDSSTSNPDQSEPAAQIERPPAPVISIPPVDRKEFDAILAEQKGRVVLVDCWATWCLPCVAQLPHSADLAKDFASNGLTVIALSFDEPEDSDQVRKTLEAAGIGSTGVVTLQSKFGSSSESLDAFEITSGALPHYKLYDRTGKLRRTFELDPSAKQQFTPTDIDTAVAELLAE